MTTINKAQALFLVELVKMAEVDPALMAAFKARMGTYGVECAQEGRVALEKAFALFPHHES